MKTVYLNRDDVYPLLSKVLEETKNGELTWVSEPIYQEIEPDEERRVALVKLHDDQHHSALRKDGATVHFQRMGEVFYFWAEQDGESSGNILVRSSKLPAVIDVLTELGHTIRG